MCTTSAYLSADVIIHLPQTFVGSVTLHRQRTHARAHTNEYAEKKKLLPNPRFIRNLRLRPIPIPEIVRPPLLPHLGSPAFILPVHQGGTRTYPLLAAGSAPRLLFECTKYMGIMIGERSSFSQADI